jgi:uncharacterized membrane protein YbhN (UPF0104 family)
MLLDRISGLVALAVLGCLFAWLAFPEVPYHFMLLAGSILLVPAMYVVHRFFGKQFLAVTAHTTIVSMVVQLIQVACAWALLRSLHVHDNTAVYLAVFLVSSLVSVLPVSVGGIGLRELVFVTAAGYAPISPESSVAFSLMFFAVTALSSLPGGFISVRK